MGAFTYPRPKKNYWSGMRHAPVRAIEHFTPQMYLFCMGTGILAVLMNRNPYQFRGLETISVVVWLLDIILFTAITATFFTRWIMFPKPTRAMFDNEIDQTTYVSTGTITIAAATLVELVALVPGAKWSNWEYVAYALWWATVLLALLGGSAVYWILIRDEEVHLSNLSPTLLYPVTGVLATASAGSVVVNYTDLSPKLAMPVIVVSYLLLGMGFFLAVLTLTAYFTRLLSHQTPEAKKIAAQFIPVGALANAAYAVDSLGYVAGPKKHIWESYGKGPVASAGVGDGLYAVGVMWGLLIWGFAIYWMIIGFLTFFSDARKTHFSLYMWSAAYPLGVFGVACTQFAIDFDSPAFRVISTAICIISVIYWIFLAVYTLPLLLSGELLLHEAVQEEESQQEHVHRHPSSRGSPEDSEHSLQA